MGIQDKVSGRLKQAAGSLTGDKGLRDQGLREERKAEAKDELDRANAEADAKAEEVARLERQSAKTKNARRTANQQRPGR